MVLCWNTAFHMVLIFVLSDKVHAIRPMTKYLKVMTKDLVAVTMKMKN